MPRSRRLVAVLCIAAVALAPFLPGVSALDCTFELTWILLPDLAGVAVAEARTQADEQPLSLFSLLPSRAPPA